MPTQETTVCSLWVGQTHESYYCADGLCSFLLKSCQWCDRAQHLVAAMGKMEKDEKGAESQELRVWGREYLSSHPFRLILTWSCHTTVRERVCVCSFICVHIKSWVWCFDWPRVYACNPWALILRTCCCLSAVCWPKELSHNQGVKC